ncbi:MAG TPA: M48 family metalloprotease [Planctomycetota bacterium]|nr:M48 family metalloprotease [Planctomycetota bacterium]
MKPPPLPDLTATAWQRELLARSGIPGSSLPRHVVTAARLPQLDSSGEQIDAKDWIEPRTDLALGISLAVAVIATLFLVVMIYPIVIGAVFLAVEYFTIRRAKTILKGSALRVGPTQFPQIHECAATFAKRLSLEEIPEVYVIDAGEVNGFALRLGRKNGIFLTDEAVAACLEGRSTGALSFVIAHEMAHIALGHQRWWRRTLRKLHWLSRLDECSADNVACELVGSSEAAQDGVLLLVAGPRLLSFVDREAARKQAAGVAEDKATGRAERSLTHPLAMHRLDRVAKRFSAKGVRRAA